MFRWGGCFRARGRTYSQGMRNCVSLSGLTVVDPIGARAVSRRRRDSEKKNQFVPNEQEVCREGTNGPGLCRAAVTSAGA